MGTYEKSDLVGSAVRVGCFASLGGNPRKLLASDPV